MSTRTQTPMLRIVYWVIVGPFALFVVLALLPIQYVFGRIERSRWPRTVDDAVNRLMNDLSEDEKRRIVTDAPHINCYLLGQNIRNGYGLWQGNAELLASCGLSDDPLAPDHDPHAADHASCIIIAALQRRIREVASESPTS